MFVRAFLPPAHHPDSTPVPSNDTTLREHRECRAVCTYESDTVGLDGSVEEKWIPVYRDEHRRCQEQAGETRQHDSPYAKVLHSLQLVVIDCLPAKLSDLGPPRLVALVAGHNDVGIQYYYALGLQQLILHLSNPSCNSRQRREAVFYYLRLPAPTGEVAVSDMYGDVLRNTSIKSLIECLHITEHKIVKFSQEGPRFLPATRVPVGRTKLPEVLRPPSSADTDRRFSKLVRTRIPTPSSEIAPIQRLQKMEASRDYAPGYHPHSTDSRSRVVARLVPDSHRAAVKEGYPGAGDLPYLQDRRAVRAPRKCSPCRSLPRVLS